MNFIKFPAGTPDRVEISDEFFPGLALMSFRSLIEVGVSWSRLTMFFISSTVEKRYFDDCLRFYWYTGATDYSLGYYGYRQPLPDQS
jgi:hypothetical protein